jgi:hypothetical protein
MQPATHDDTDRQVHGHKLQLCGDNRQGIISIKVFVFVQVP